MSEAPVLVVGASGRTGRLLVGRLLERRASVRALVRDGAKGERVLPSEVPRFVADVRRLETLIEPMADVGAVIIATCGSAERDNDAEMVDYHGTRNLIEQAAAVDVELVVFISTIYASRPEHYMDVEPTSLGWKARAEEVIRGSGVPYCIIRSGWLTDGGGGEPLAVSQGDTAEGRISRADLADVCTQLLFVPGARGKTFDVVAAQAGQATSLACAVTALRPDSTQRTRVRPVLRRRPPTWRPTRLDACDDPHPRPPAPKMTPPPAPPTVTRRADPPDRLMPDRPAGAPPIADFFHGHKEHSEAASVRHEWKPR